MRPTFSRMSKKLLAAAALSVVTLTGCQTADTPKASIVDQLSLTHPHPDFVAGTTELLERAGYDVAYFPGEDVSVDLIRSLPARGDSLIILRMHAARIEVADVKTDDVALFTGEPIDLARYNVSGVPAPAATAIAVHEAHKADGVQLASSARTHSPGDVANLIPVYYDPASGELPFFGVRPAFIENSVVGEFGPGSTVILMGCDGLRSPALAEAFVERGAEAFVSWTEPVTVRHTDRATTRLLQLLVSGASLSDAIDQTMDEIGPDPSFSAMLVALP